MKMYTNKFSNTMSFISQILWKVIDYIDVNIVSSFKYVWFIGRNNYIKTLVLDIVP